MTDIEARQIAQQYVSEMGEVLPGFMFGLGNEEKFIDNYYFGFIWLTLKGEIPKEPPLAGGARGLTVNKHDGQVELQSHGSHAALIDYETELTETYQLLSDFKNGKLQPTELKAKFDLTSKQLFELSKFIKETDLNREATHEIVRLFELA
ncbi:MAG: hypothetical protein HYZ42_08370 [Bacteroidetes bacterium]|nr:hypothetical protein [Bacteroidota bacterium]